MPSDARRRPPTMMQVRWLIRRRSATARDGQISPEKRKVGSSTLPLTTRSNQANLASAWDNVTSWRVCLRWADARRRPLKTASGRPLLHVDCTASSDARLSLDKVTYDGIFSRAMSSPSDVERERLDFIADELREA